MPTPSHVRAFQFISEGATSEIRDYIAFGIFMKAEASWAAKKGDLSETQYSRYHDHLLTSFQRERLRTEADLALVKFAAEAVDEKSAELCATIADFDVREYWRVSLALRVGPYY
jgi:hypothetical protein